MALQCCFQFVLSITLLVMWLVFDTFSEIILHRCFCQLKAICYDHLRILMFHDRLLDCLVFCCGSGTFLFGDWRANRPGPSWHLSSQQKTVCWCLYNRMIGKWIWNVGRVYTARTFQLCWPLRTTLCFPFGFLLLVLGCGGFCLFNEFHIVGENVTE